MTLHVYKLNDTIHADGVDMKRVARSLLKEWGTQAAGPLPPMRDLSDAMEVIARSFGYRNLHECQRVASAAGSPVALAPVESSRPNPGLDAGALTARIVDVHTLIAGESRIRRNEMLAEMASQEITRGGGLVILDAGPGGRIFDRIQASAKSAKRNLNVLDPRASAAAEPKPFEVSLNPFVSGTVKELTQLLNRLAGHGTERPDVWEAKTQRFIPALMQVLVRMRDRDGVLINAQA